MSANEFFLFFCRFETDVPPGIKPESECQREEYGYYGWQSDVDADEIFSMPWQTAEQRDRDIAGAGGVLGYLLGFDLVLKSQLLEAWWDEAHEKTTETAVIYLNVNGSQFELVKNHEGDLVRVE